MGEENHFAARGVRDHIAVVGRPAGRGSFLDGLPHRTAVLVELDSGTEYAIDSWFYDNGRRPEVVLLARWLDGWKPETQ